MKYKKLSNEELQTFPFPNLIAELIESGYSICTLGEHMGLDGRREQDDPEILGKLRGREGIPASEALGLCKLFNVEFSYLFNPKLGTTGGKPLAYHRWYEWNRQEEKEYKELCLRMEIERELREKPYLLEFMKEATKWSPEEVKAAAAILTGVKAKAPK